MHYPHSPAPTSPRRRRLLTSALATAGATAFLGATVMTGSAGAIVNGHDSTQRYPFMATIPMKEADAQCGATLIDRQWVLTAAHCVKESTPAGTVRIGSEHRKTGGTVRKIDKTVVHPGYVPVDDDGAPSRNDLALVRLDRPVTQKPLRIAAKTGPAGTHTRILGFGTVIDIADLKDAKFPARMQELDTRRGSEAECFGRVDNTRLCTVSLKPKAMACFGDSGGPQLQRTAGGRWELVGATSGDGDWDSTCSTGPGLYTNVPVYKKWINKTLHENR
ncbi:S1 family peptidase [Streptomyces sp. NPDC059063]|uniref:S1 family peptidase n=1 Tax=unclassified Streptomyces TaxID=2593676 RepID=UPI0036746705